MARGTSPRASSAPASFRLLQTPEVKRSQGQAKQKHALHVTTQCRCNIHATMHQPTNLPRTCFVSRCTWRFWRCPLAHVQLLASLTHPTHRAFMATSSRHTVLMQARCLFQSQFFIFFGLIPNRSRISPSSTSSLAQVSISECSLLSCLSLFSH